jgi:hypothetical protein
MSSEDLPSFMSRLGKELAEKRNKQVLDQLFPENEKPRRRPDFEAGILDLMRYQRSSQRQMLTWLEYLALLARKGIHMTIRLDMLNSVKNPRKLKKQWKRRVFDQLRRSSFPLNRCRLHWVPGRGWQVDLKPSRRKPTD